jgi:DNA-binding response OmpR family regulator
MTRILVLEDELKALDIIQKGLSQRGYEVVAAANAGDALDLAQAFQPQILLADWLLKGEENGLDVAQTLREFDPDLVLVFFSGLPLKQLERAARHLQPCTFLQKPCGLNQLEASLKTALNHDIP